MRSTPLQPTIKPPTQATDRPRWYRLYFLLALLDIVTVSISIGLNVKLMNSYSASVEINQAWSARQENYAALAALATETNAPGNDVFDGLDTAVAKRQMLRSLEQFNASLAAARNDIVKLASAERAPLLATFASIDAAMTEMHDIAMTIFGYFDAGEAVKAGERMATMDRKFGKLNASIAHLSTQVRAIQRVTFNAQLRSAQEMRRVEYGILLLVILMVLGALYYGRRIAAEIKKSTIEQESQSDEIRRLNASLEERVQRRTEELHGQQEELRQRNNEILHLNAGLEERVQQRTEELQSQQEELRQSTVQLQDRENTLSATINTALDAVVQMDAAGTITRWNNQAEKIFGWLPVEAIGLMMHETIIPPQYREAHIRGLKHFLATGEGPVLNKRIEITAQHRDGHEFPIELSITPLKLAGKHEFTAFVRDITERKRAEEALHESENRFRSMFERTADALLLLDPRSGQFIDCNQATMDMLRCTDKKEILLLHPSQISPLHQPDGQRSDEKAAEMIATALRSGSHRFEWTHRSDHREDFPVEVLLTPILMGERQLITVTWRDITERKESEELIWQQVNFDTLTGLPNRHMFYDRLAQEIKKSHRSGLPMALMLLDLDHFKEVNDTLGHAQGDVLLAEAARRIAECVRKSDTVARLGGDEFTVILSEMEDVNSVGRIAQNIIERIAAPFQLLQESTYVSASMGITLYPNDAQDVDTLMKNADQAMYVAKNSGRNRFSYFTAVLQESAQTRMHLISDLRKALPGKQLVVYYQPIVEMASGKIHKAEALLRWQHPERGMVNPAQFIPLAEESGLIHEIGDWVFHEAARELKRWRELFVPEFQISVNKSPVQFRKDGSDCVSWPSYLRAMDLPGHSLVIEITEGLLLNAEINVTENLLAFRDAGVQVALDDFGTGYSSLSYLKKFDIDYLKIDQSFVRNLQDDPDDQALCEAIIVMAHKLGLKVIAEGVETEQQRDLLAAYGCDYAQGWLYSKAIPAGEFEALLQEQVK